jgi:hypothetical protein
MALDSSSSSEDTPPDWDLGVIPTPFRYKITIAGRPFFNAMPPKPSDAFFNPPGVNWALSRGVSQTYFEQTPVYADGFNETNHCSYWHAGLTVPPGLGGDCGVAGGRAADVYYRGWKSDGGIFSKHCYLDMPSNPPPGYDWDNCTWTVYWRAPSVLDTNNGTYYEPIIWAEAVAVPRAKTSGPPGFTLGMGHSGSGIQSSSLPTMPCAPFDPSQALTDFRMPLNMAWGPTPLTTSEKKFISFLEPFPIDVHTGLPKPPAPQIIYPNYQLRFDPGWGQYPPYVPQDQPWKLQGLQNNVLQGTSNYDPPSDPFYTYETRRFQFPGMTNTYPRNVGSGLFSLVNTNTHETVAAAGYVIEVVPNGDSLWVAPFYSAGPNRLDELVEPVEDMTIFVKNKSVYDASQGQIYRVYWYTSLFGAPTWFNDDGSEDAPIIIPGDAFWIRNGGQPYNLMFLGQPGFGQWSTYIDAGWTLKGPVNGVGGTADTLGLTSTLVQGDSIRKWNSTNSTWTTFTRTASGWSPSVPVINQCEGVVINSARNTSWIHNTAPRNN